MFALRTPNLGAVNFAFGLLLWAPAIVNAQAFSNDTEILIPAAGVGPGAAAPYPGEIAVSGLTEPIESVTVSLFSLQQTRANDLDILLVGPQNQTVLLMSDTGSTFSIPFVDLTFADGAPPLPQLSMIEEGTYSPTDYAQGSADTFDAPAPAGPYGMALSVFTGADGNGTWRLFAYDDTPGGGQGRIENGWSITITQEPAPITYQGRVNQAGAPINGTADLVFDLFDAPTAGTLIATAAHTVPVADGLFTVDLQFGPGAFNGSNRWVEITMRSPSGTGVVSTLAPRQRITPAPDALYAQKAGAIEKGGSTAVFVDNAGNVGIGTTNPESGFRLDVAGNIRCTALTETSSRSLKENIEPIAGALATVSRLQGVRFNWHKRLGGRADLGFVAEDVAGVLPELVTWDTRGAEATGLKYGHLTAVAVEAIKEQQDQITSMKSTLADRDVEIAEQRDRIMVLTARVARLEAAINRFTETGKP